MAFQTRKQLFDYGEAEEKQYDMVHSVEDAGSWLSGLDRMYGYQNKKMEDQGGFFGAYKDLLKKPASDLWGSFGTEGTAGFDPGTLTKATQDVKKLTGAPKDALQSKIAKAMAGDWKGMTGDQRWTAQIGQWKTQNPLVEAVAGEQGSGLLGQLEKVPGVGDFVKKAMGKVAGKGLGSFLSKANAYAAPLMMAKGIHTAAQGISDEATRLEGVDHDLGVAGTAIKQGQTTVSTDLHNVMKDAVSRVKEGGSNLNEQYGATALKVLSQQDQTVGKSNLEGSDFIDGEQGGVMDSLVTSRISAGDNLQKQANYQVEQGVGSYVGASTDLLTQLQKNEKLRAEVGDQQDKMEGIVNLARRVPFVSG